jgi:hypothetical protein
MKLAAPLLISLVGMASLLAGASCTKAQFETIDAAPTPPADAATIRDAQSQEPIVCSATPVQGCVSKWLPCDPVCQDKTCPDWCTQKCSFAYGPDNKPKIACVANQHGKRALFETCSVEHSGTDQQTDDCAVGGICLPVFKGGDTLCFKLCHDSTECIAGECAPRALSSVGGTVTVCDPQYAQCGEATKPCCDPLKNTGCGTNQYCFLVSADPSTHSRTLCDYSYGDGRDNDPCSSSRDCQQLYTCVEGACKQVCTDSASCSSKTCVARGGEYGYCQ